MKSIAANCQKRTDSRAAVILCFFLLNFAHISSVSGSDTVFETMVSVLTNFPPIKNLILEAQYFSPRPTLLQFRYQDGSLYARQLSDADPESAYFRTPRDDSFGRWGDEYWFLTPGFSKPYRPILTTGMAAGADSRVLQVKAIKFESIFSYFASFGITPQGVNTVRYEGDHIVALVDSHDPNHQSVFPQAGH